MDVHTIPSDATSLRSHASEPGACVVLVALMGGGSRSAACEGVLRVSSGTCSDRCVGCDLDRSFQARSDSRNDQSGVLCTRC
jgi:hypothetical protein